MTVDKRLSIYLNDHLGGAAAGTELAKRTASSNEGTEFSEPLSRIAREIDEDKRALEGTMTELEIQKNPIKHLAGWAAEKAGRLKLNGQILGYSPLSRVVELEGLVAGVTGKLALWETLKALSEKDPRLDGAVFDGLIKRAVAQRDELNDVRRKASEIAFTGPSEV
jgi:hypothetical protein